MATSAEYLEFVLENLKDFDGLTYRKMFGEYMIYINKKPVLSVCDNTVFVKKLPELEEIMKNSDCSFPYPGAKQQYILDIENTELVKRVFKILSEK